MTTVASLVGHRTLAFPDPWTRFVVLADVLQLVAIFWLAWVLARRSVTGPSAAPLDTRLAVLAGVLVVLSVAAARLIPALTVAAVLFGGALLTLAIWLLRQVPTTERWWVWPVAGTALGLRLAAAVAMHLYGLSLGGRAIALDDESAYDYGAQALAAVFTTPMSELPWEWRHLMGQHFSLLSGLYFLFGPDPVTIRLADAFLGAVAVVIGAAVARSLAGRAAGFAVGIILAAIPSLVFLSATLLREGLVMALVMLVLWAFLRTRSSLSPSLAVLLVGALEVLVSLRVHVGLGLGIGVVLALLVSLVARRATIAARGRVGVLALAGTGATAVVTIAALVWLLLPTLRDNLSPTNLLYRQTVMALTPPPYELLGDERSRVQMVKEDAGGPIVSVRERPDGPEQPGMVIAYKAGGLSYVVTTRSTLLLVPNAQVRDIHTMDPVTASQYLLVEATRGLGITLFAPLTTGIVRGSYLVFAFEWLLWAGALVVAALGVARSRDPFMVLPLTYLAVVILALVVVPGHPGNLIRQRTVLVLPVLLILGSPVLGSLAERAYRSSGSLRGIGRVLNRSLRLKDDSPGEMGVLSSR